MKISGFSMIRNAELMGYPIIESIKSVLPLVDEFVIGVGQSDEGDHTKELIQSINDPKIKIFDSHWDTGNNKGGRILAEKTDEALDHCSNDWCFYLQADEVIHEDDYDNIKAAVAEAAQRPEVEGLLFRYVHFYGSYSVVATNRKWYRNEIRVVRKSSGIRSYRDAQGFRIDDRKAKVIPANARILHYGWVKPPQQMGQKYKFFSRWWHGNKRDNDFNDFQYDRQYGLKPYEGTHPKIMQERVAKQDWTFDYKKRLGDWKLKDFRLVSSDVLEAITGHRFGEYKNYNLIK